MQPTMSTVQIMIGTRWMGNTDRHWENWGLLVDNQTNKPIRLHDLMDFNRAFQQYDTLEGANCLTVGKRHLSQREAAIEAVKKIGMNQKCDISYRRKKSSFFKRCWNGRY